MDNRENKNYVNSILIINSKELSLDDKINMLLAILKGEPKLSRTIFNFLNSNDKLDFFTQNRTLFLIEELIDIVWYLPIRDKILEDVKSNILELEILDIIQNSNSSLKIDLKFEYICSNCSIKIPIFRDRCDNCLSIFTIRLNLKIIRDDIDLRYLSF